MGSEVVGAPVTFDSVMSSPAPVAVMLGVVAGVIGGFLFIVSIFAVPIVVTEYRKLCARKVEAEKDG